MTVSFQMTRSMGGRAPFRTNPLGPVEIGVPVGLLSDLGVAVEAAPFWQAVTRVSRSFPAKQVLDKTTMGRVMALARWCKDRRLPACLSVCRRPPHFGISAGLFAQTL